MAILLLRLPSVQQYITDKATAYISGKTHTTLTIGRLYVGFPKNIVIEELYAEDLNRDTLIYLKTLDVNVGLWQLLNNKLQINTLTINGMTANVHRILPDSSFNFDFLIQAFAGKKEPKPEVKDTAKSDFAIDVKEIRFSNLHLLYDDVVSGIYTKGNIGELSIDIDELDIRLLKFKLDNLRLAHTDAVFEIRRQSKAERDTAITTEEKLPDIGANKIELKSVTFGFHHIPDSSAFDFGVGNLLVELNEIDLNKQWVDVKRLVLSGGEAHLVMKRNNTKTDRPGTEDTTASRQNWKVAAADVALNNTSFSMHITNMPVATSGIDYNHLEAKQVELLGEDLYYSPTLIKCKVKQVALKERSGIELQKFRTTFVYDSVHTELANLWLQTSRSTISNYAYVSYPSVTSLSSNVGELKVNASFKQTKVSMEDVLVFAPQLANEPVIARNRNAEVVLSGKLNGKVSDIIADNLMIQTASQTSIACNAKLKGLPDISRLWFDIDLKLLTTGRKDLAQLLPDSIIPTSIRVPDQLILKGHAEGLLKHMTADIAMKSSDGDAQVKGMYEENANVPEYTVDLRTDNLNVGRILKQEPLLGKITLTVKAKGQSFKPQDIVAGATAEIEKLEVNGYSISHISLNAIANRGLYKTELVVADSKLDLQLDAEASILEDSSFLKVLLNLRGADLQSLKLARSDVRSSGVLKADIQNFTIENMRGSLSITNVVLIKNAERYKLDSLIMVTFNEKRKSKLSIKNSIVQVEYQGSTGLHEVSAVVQNHIARYLGHTQYIADTVQHDFTCVITINPHPILSEVLLPNLTKFSGLNVTSSFNSSGQKFSIEANSSYIEYDQQAVNNFKAKVVSDEDKVTYDFSVAGISSGSVFLPKTSLSGKAQDNVIDFAVSVIHPDSGNKLLIAGDINRQKATETVIHIDDGAIVLNNEKWTIEANNRITIAQKGINIRGLNITHNDQSIRANSVSAEPNAPIDIIFEKFEVGTISRIIEKDTALVRGVMDGDLHIKHIGPLAFTSNIKVSNITFKEASVGNLQITADNLSENRYTATAVLSGYDNQARVSGYYQDNELDFAVDVKRLNLSAIELFSGNMMKRSQGYIAADIKVKGKSNDPSFNGSVSFKDASFLLTMLNTRLQMKNESIHIDDKGVYLKKFTVYDSLNQPMAVSGSVTDFSRMNFNLDITTHHFTVMNTTAQDNKVYYGRLIVNSNIRVRGDKNLPVITSDVGLADGSSFTFVVQEGDLVTTRGEGIVFFEDTTTFSDLMSLKKDTVKMKSEFRGIDITANLQVNRNTVFRVIVDPKSGDNLEVQGDANLSFAIDPSGKVSLSGVYVLNDGHYKASFQKVMKREFNIKPGSSITWSGDPMDGQMDLTAVYSTKATATDLLANELSGMSETERMAYRKLLTYYVNLMIKGPVLKPEISFELDMAPKDQNAFGGIVYSKINVINTDPNELNKQVFSLLVLNKFLPSGNSSGMGTGAAVSTAARNSVNQVLTDQLNSLSGKYIKGFELNFDLQTTDDYVSGTKQSNTALQVGAKKNFFNERVSVQVGSSIDLTGGQQQAATGSQNITGDVVVEYKITEDGRYRFKAFRENQFEGIIDGMLYKTGVGIVFTRDYDNISELFKSPSKKEEEKTGTKKETN